MTRLLQALGYSMGFAFFLFAAMIILNLLVPLAFLEALKSAPQAGNSAPATAVMVTLAGVLVALAGHFWTQARNAGESQEKLSRFYLDSCVYAYDEAQRLLIDGNNHRATWIAAGRALKYAKELSGKITTSAHRSVMEVHKLRYRRFFSDLLKDKPAAFFYGVKDTTLSIEEAAKLSSAVQDRSGRPTFTETQLDGNSLHAIWEAAQFPKEYRDPLEMGFSEEDKWQVKVFYPGLHKFLGHYEQWNSSSGILYPRDKKRDH